MAAPAPGSKHHLLCDRTGIALAVTLTGGHCNDVTQLLPLIDGVDPVRGKPRRPRLRAESLIADRGYDHDKYRRALWARGVKPIIARRATEHGSGLGRLRWVVERTFAWLHQFRRLRLRWERLPELHEAFMHLACAFICQRYLRVCKTGSYSFSAPGRRIAMQRAAPFACHRHCGAAGGRECRFARRAAPRSPSIRAEARR